MIPNNIFSIEQYSLPRQEKKSFLFEKLRLLHRFHLDHCAEYEKISRIVFPGPVSAVEDLPYLPVSIFKNHEIKSIPDQEVFKIITSSGTTGSAPSRIFLDKNTAALQTKALSNIMQFTIGRERLPMLLVDSSGLIKDRNSFSARGAGVLGMSVFGKSHTYLLDEKMNPDIAAFKTFAEKNKDRSLIFGFTFMVWLYLYEQMPEADLSNAVLIHSGGWKKLMEKKVDNETFKQKLNDKFGLKRIYNFYGMAEQVGSVFMECEAGYLHTPIFAEVIIRSTYNFSPLPVGMEGVIQVLSILPQSYPGHSLLTEDLGIIHGEDNCRCGRMGKYFSISGRMKQAELRGCSDTFAYNSSKS